MRADEIKRMTFGKFEGVALAALPPWYVRWLLNQPWLSPELRANLTTEAGEVND